MDQAKVIAKKSQLIWKRKGKEGKLGGFIGKGRPGCRKKAEFKGS